MYVPLFVTVPLFFFPRRAKQESTTATRLEEERKGRQKRQQEADDEEDEEESDEESRAKDANLRRFLAAWARRLRRVRFISVSAYPKPVLSSYIHISICVCTLP